MNFPGQFTPSRLLIAATAMCLCALLSGCASSKAPTDEGSYTLGEKEENDPMSLHGSMEVSVGYATGDFPDARRAKGPARW